MIQNKYHILLLLSFIPGLYAIEAAPSEVSNNSNEFPTIFITKSKFITSNPGIVSEDNAPRQYRMENSEVEKAVMDIGKIQENPSHTRESTADVTNGDAPDKKEEINKIDPVTGLTPLSGAIENKSLPDIRKLLNNGANINISGNNGLTALHHAVIKNDLIATVMLLNKGANTNAIDNNGMTPLHYAAKNGNTVSVKLLLNHKADPTILDKDAMTPLHHAAQENKQNTLLYFCNHGFNNLTEYKSSRGNVFTIVNNINDNEFTNKFNRSCSKYSKTDIWSNFLNRVMDEFEIGHSIKINNDSPLIYKSFKPFERPGVSVSYNETRVSDFSMHYYFVSNSMKESLISIAAFINKNQFEFGKEKVISKGGKRSFTRYNAQSIEDIYRQFIPASESTVDIFGLPASTVYEWSFRNWIRERTDWTVRFLSHRELFARDTEDFEKAFMDDSKYFDSLHGFSNERIKRYIDNNEKFSKLTEYGIYNTGAIFAFLHRRRMDGTLSTLLLIIENFLRKYDPDYHNKHGESLLQLAEDYK